MTYRELINKFIEIYGGDDKEIRIFEAPGRVNLIGEHTDYNGGYVFPAALTLSTVVVARKRTDDVVKLAATTLPDRVTASTKTLDNYRTLPWGNYQLGVAYIMQQEGYTIPGCELLYHGTIPFGGGLSSSASIEVATAIALSKLANEDLDPVQAALIGQKAENTYVGMNCGIMDQFASAMGKKDCAILLDCSTLEYRHVPLNLGGHKIVIINTNKPRRLVESKYNERRAQCEAAFAALRTRLPGLKSLCALTPEQLEQNKDLIADETVYRRARHAIAENARTLQAVDALERNNLALFGKLMNASHESLRDDYEVTGKELDAIYDAGVVCGGVVGIRMTGAGFGGCAVAIVHGDAIVGFEEQVGRDYEAKTGYKASFYVSDIGDGGREVTDY